MTKQGFKRQVIIIGYVPDWIIELWDLQPKTYNHREERKK